MPLLESLNNYRESCHANAKLNCINPYQPAKLWLEHKVVSVISLPLNGVAAVSSLGLLALSISTIGVAKIFVYSLTLGTCELPLSTHFCELGDITAKAIVNILLTFIENIEDAVNLTISTCELGISAAKKLHLDKCLAAISKVAKFILSNLGECINFFAKRIFIGIKTALDSETHTFRLLRLLDPLSPIVESCQKLRAYSNDRTVSTIFKHYVFSIPNVLLFAGLGAIAFAAIPLTGSAFLFKATLMSTTNLNLQINTLFVETVTLATYSTFSIATDIGIGLADVFVLSYKAVDSLGIIRAAATVLDVIAYIPKAIIS